MDTRTTIHSDISTNMSSSGKKYASDTHKEERQEKEEEPDWEKTVTKNEGEVTMWKKKSNALCTE